MLIGSTGIQITCKIVKLQGSFSQISPLAESASIKAAVLSLKECALEGEFAKKCLFPAEVTTVALVGSFTHEEPSKATTLKPETGTTWLSFSFTNNGTETCPATIKGEKKLTGEQVCTNVEPESMQLEHQLDCLASGSKLQLLGEQSAEMAIENETIQLENASTDKWGLFASPAGFELLKTECLPGAIPTFCYEEGSSLREFVGEELFVGSLTAGGKALLQATLGANMVELLCKASSISGMAKQTAPLAVAASEKSVVLVLTECALQGGLATKCKVPSELKMNSLVGELANEEPVKTTTYRPESGTSWLVVAFSNNGAETCPATVAGEKKLTGEQSCQNVEPETLLSEHEIDCATTGSKLKLGESTAEFDLKNALIHLMYAGPDKWGVFLG